MKLYFDFYNQWEPFFRHEAGKWWNWIDFTFISLGVEHSPYKCSCEISGMLLGLGGGLTLSWYKPSDSQSDADSP